MKTSSTPIKTNKALVKDEEADSVDVHLYRSMIRSLMYLTASRPDIMFVFCACARDSPFDLEAFSDGDRKSTTGGCQFLGKRLISWQCKKQTIVANSTTEAEYVAAANCCGQVLWIQNQMLDYGFNFMNTKIYIDNESTICVVKNPVFHSKTKHIEIRHHFIRDSYEKRLIQVIKIHTDHNVADLLTKDFDVSRFNFLVASIDKKELAIPGQTATGKEFSNPLMAGCLQKTISVKFWNIATSKTVNSVKQIHAIVDGKEAVISESSVRNDLLFDDEDGITCLTNDEIFENLALMGNLDPKKFLMYPRFLQLFLNNQLKDLPEPFNDTYDTPSHTKKVFSNMARQSKGFSGKVTLLFDSMLVQNHAPEGEVSHEPQTEAHIEQILPSPSTYHRKHRKTQKHRRAKKVTELPQTSVPLDLGADEAVHKEGVTGMDTGGSPRRQETMGGALAQTRSERVLEKPNEPPLLEGYTPGSEEGRMALIQELMETYTSLTKRVLALEEAKTAQDRVITRLKLRFKRLKKKRKAITSQHMNRRMFKGRVESSNNDLDEEDVSKQERTDDKTKPMFEDSDFDELDDDMENVEVEGETYNIATTRVSVVSAPVTTVGVAISTAEPRTPLTTTATAFIDEDLTIAQTLVKMMSEKAKVKGIAFSDVEETPKLNRSTTTLQPLPTTDPKYKGKGVLVEEEPKKPEKVKRRDQGLAQIESDAELAQRLHEEELAELDRAQKERQKQEEATSAALAEEFDEIQARIDADHELAVRLTHEEQEKYTIEERARLLAEFFERRKKQLAAERAEAIRNKPPTRTQVRNMMITYLKHMGKYTHQQLKHKNFEEVQKLYEREKKWIDDFKPIDDDSQQQAESTKKRPRADSEEESSKKQKLEEDNDAEKEELRDSMDVVPRDDVAIDVESLATKYPIVDWKTHILNENMMYYQIIRADGSSKNYKIFSEMLDDFDRQDVIDLHRLVNERYETTSLEGYDLLLWGDLKTLFEPNEEDEIWKNQQDYNLISWRLFDSCGVHVLLMNTGVAIHMMIEKKYPLTQEMLSRMLNRRLEVDYESEMAFELLRFTRSQLQK
ncbi:hypothetical protein Tco_0156953 [Tanacetum coccineum]